MPEIANELGVDALIEGSVLAEGDQVRITVQLIDGATDRHLWAESYQRQMRSVLALQSEMARAIVDELETKVSPQEQQRLVATREVNPAAHEAYLKGRYYLQAGTSESYKRSFEFFQQAVKLDSNDPLAYASLADTYYLMGNHSLLPPDEASMKAKAAAQRAIELDENLSEAHAALANVLHQYDWNQVAAEKEYRRALELRPSDATITADFGLFLCKQGQFEEAIQEAKRAQQLDPLNLNISTNLGAVLEYSRYYDEAIAQLRKVLELDPRQNDARSFLAWAHAYKGEFDQAIGEFRRMHSIDPSDRESLPAISVMQGFAGNRAASLQTLKELKQKQDYVKPYMMAYLALASGDNNQALDWLEKACDERDDWVTWLHVDPIMDPLHSEPRFQKILKRVGLPVTEKS